MHPACCDCWVLALRPLVRGARSRLASTLPTVMVMASLLLFWIMKEPRVGHFINAIIFICTHPCFRWHYHQMAKPPRYAWCWRICDIYLFIFLCFDFLPFLVCSSSSMQLQHHNLLFLDISIKVRDRCFDILNVILNIYLALLLCIPKVKRVDSRNLSKLRERWSNGFSREDSQTDRVDREATWDPSRIR